MPAIRAWYLTAQARCGHDLARVGKPIGIEGTAQLLERRQVGLTEHLRHVALLVYPNAVLARNGPAGVDTGLHDQSRQLLGPLGLPLLRPVVTGERVKVAIAGGENVGHLNPVLVLKLR